ncbi:MAG TPA: hypothetical protein VGC81_14900 [Candidatus Methylomirabilis sp.]|jgi:hypothetical protein
MTRERTGKGIAVLALLVSLIALWTSILAYREAAGDRVLRDQVRALQGTLEGARKEMANLLERMEDLVRPAEQSRRVPPPGKSEGGAGVARSNP